MIEKSKEPFCNIEFKIYDALAFPIALRLNTSSEDFRYYLRHVLLHTDSKLLKGKMCQQFCEKKCQKSLPKTLKFLMIESNASSYILVAHLFLN